MRFPYVLAAALLCSALVQSRALADGTIAIAEPRDVARDGFAVGVSYNYSTRAEADAEALHQCRTFEGVTPQVRQLCTIRGNFDDQCVAVAMDPEPGTYGWGWAVYPNQPGADDIALRNCRNASAPGRAGYCQVTLRHCDGTADTGGK
jgi:hypothetical protein